MELMGTGLGFWGGARVPDFGVGEASAGGTLL